VLDRLHDELGDAFTAGDLERLSRIVVDQAHLQLTAVAGVDQPRGVQDGDPVLERKTAPRLDQAGVALRKRDRDAGGDEGPTASGSKGDVLSGDQVDTGVPRSCVRRERQVGIEAEDGEIKHGAKLADAGVYPDTMLAWMDLEMTGLEPDRHVIVEIATLLTDDDLELIAEGPDLIVHATPEQLAEMDDFVTNMHTRSGLLDQITASTITLEEAGAQTLAFLQAHIPEPRTVPLCGNSIGTDRRFLAAHLPEVEEFLHYRSIDVSTLKELARRWNPDALKTAPKKAGGHRALDDIRESLEELRHYRQALFVSRDASS
jgi:oligoribonuclease